METTTHTGLRWSWEGTLGSGGNGPLLKEVLVLESYQYSYIFILLLQYHQYPEPEGLYVNIYYSSGTYSDTDLM